MVFIPPTTNRDVHVDVLDNGNIAIRRYFVATKGDHKGEEIPGTTVVLLARTEQERKDAFMILRYAASVLQSLKDAPIASPTSKVSESPIFASQPVTPPQLSAAEQAARRQAAQAEVNAAAAKAAASKSAASKTASNDLDAMLAESGLV